MSFGGGYDNYNGGFMHSQHDASMDQSPGQQKGKGSRSQQSLIPVTIKMIQQATQDHPEDSFKIDGRECSQITFIGIIVSLNETSTNINYTIEDGTGMIKVTKWIEDVENEHTAMKRAEWRENVYVRVVGSLRQFVNERSVSAFHIRSITNFNEITYHCLDVIHAHVQQKRGPLPTAGGSAMMNSTSSIGNFNGGAGLTMGGSSFQAGGSFSNDQSMVLQAFTALSQGSETGPSIRQVAQYLKGKMEEFTIRKAIEFLSQEGHLYSTIDEDHYKTTSE